MKEVTLTELEMLCSELCDGSISAEELAHLDVLLCTRPDARRWYIRYMNLHGNLGSIASGSAKSPDDVVAPDAAIEFVAESPGAASTDSEAGWARHTASALFAHPMATAYISASTFLAASILVLAIIRAPTLDPGRATDDSQFVAVLSNLNDCVWEKTATSFRRGTRLAGGQRIQLTGGLVEITYDDGAVVIFEGPGSYEITAAGRGCLDAGRLAARVPSAAAGFTIHTPCVDVIDLGTEFAIKVKDSASEVHVFRGAVLTSASYSDETLRLTAGDAARFDEQLAQIEKLQANQDLFVRAMISDAPRTAGDPEAPTTPQLVQRKLVSERARTTVFVPTDDNGGDQLGLSWVTPDFEVPHNWVRGTTGIGYETEPADYRNLISLDVKTMMYKRSTSLLIRIPFHVDRDPAEIEFMKLRMKFDNGFVAFLNGTKLAQANAPRTLEWNSKATESNQDTVAKEYKDFVVTEHIDLLSQGENTLAIQGLNTKKDSSDFLILPELVAHYGPESSTSPVEVVEPNDQP